MLNFRKQLAILLVVVLTITTAFSMSIISFADDEVVYEFASAKWNWWGATQGNQGGWFQNNNALTRNYSSGTLTYDVAAKSDTQNTFNQIQDKWKSLPQGNLYFNFTNNATASITVTIDGDTGGRLFSQTVAAGATKKIEFTNEKAENFSIFLINWSINVPVGDGLFVFSPIYKQPDESHSEVPVVDESGKNVIYRFASANHNWSKTEGWYGAASAWGTFATTSYDIKSNGAADMNVTADSYDKFRQLNTNWKNVPASTEPAFIEITNNSNRAVKVKITTPGYTTPADSNLPLLTVGETKEFELGALTGGNLAILLMDSSNTDSITAGDAIFTLSPIYNKVEDKEIYSVSLDGVATDLEEGSTYELPVNDDSDFVGYYDGEKIYDSGESIVVNDNISLETLSLSLSMRNGASIRFSSPSGLRFYSNIDTDELEVLENLGAEVKLGTILAPSDLIGTNELDFDLTAGKYVTIPFNTRKWYQEDGFSGFVGSIVNIKDTNINRDFVARGYAKVKLGEFETTVYADYTSNNISNNTRSIKFVANAFKSSAEYSSLNATLKAVIDKYAD